RSRSCSWGGRREEDVADRVRRASVGAGRVRLQAQAPGRGGGRERAGRELVRDPAGKEGLSLPLPSRQRRGGVRARGRRGAALRRGGSAAARRRLRRL